MKIIHLFFKDNVDKPSTHNVLGVLPRLSFLREQCNSGHCKPERFDGWFDRNKECTYLSNNRSILVMGGGLDDFSSDD